jgi:hypothetical protein
MSEMSLASAIRLGAMLRPQVRGVYWSAEGTCAIGAALEACGVTNTTFAKLPSVEASARWPILDTKIANAHRPLSTEPMTLFDVITDMNDCMGMSREEIASWLEPIEAEYARQQAAAQEVVTA